MLQLFCRLRRWRWLQIRSIHCSFISTQPFLESLAFFEIGLSFYCFFLTKALIKLQLEVSAFTPKFCNGMLLMTFLEKFYYFCTHWMLMQRQWRMHCQIKLIKLLKIPELGPWPLDDLAKKWIWSRRPARKSVCLSWEMAKFVLILYAIDQFSVRFFSLHINSHPL